MSEVKPIVVIYLPENYPLGNESKNAPMELMKALNGNFGEEDLNYKTRYNDYWNQYYWFCFYKEDILEPEFRVFYEKDFTPIQFEELKNLFESAIKNHK